MKVFNQRLHQISKTVHMLKQSFPHGLSLGDNHFWTLQDLCLAFTFSCRCSQLKYSSLLITDTVICKVEKVQCLLACSQKKRTVFICSLKMRKHSGRNITLNITFLAVSAVGYSHKQDTDQRNRTTHALMGSFPFCLVILSKPLGFTQA